MIQFTKDCMIGVENLDNQHRYLFELMQKGIDVLNNQYILDRYEKVKEILRELDEYAEEHFDYEENYMVQIRDPELILQRIQHNYFRRKVEEMMVVNINDDEDQQRLMEELISFLAKWLYRHIISSDILIGKLPPLDEWLVKENPCEFTDEYRTGIALIDEEHKELFRITAKANDMVRYGITQEGVDEVLTILKELRQYTVEHFQDEEEYMESIQYDGFEIQKRAHNAFIDRIDEVNIQNMEDNLQQNLEELVEYLLGWLVNHIMNLDKKIPTY